MITFQHITKAFGQNEVLKGIDLAFERPGTISAILGPNGSGKTTLIKTLLGMVLPDTGRILLNGQDIKQQWAYRNRVDYLPQIARFPENLSVQELLSMIKDIRSGATREAELIHAFDLAPFLDKRLGTLSGGTKQKVNLTLALMYDSPIVILDEPTSGLDPVAMIQLKNIIREERARGKTVLITTHIMSFVEEMADEIVFLLEGKIYFRGSITEIAEQHGGASLEAAIANILRKQDRPEANNKPAERAELQERPIWRRIAASFSSFF